MSDSNNNAASIRQFPRVLARGIGQVMFQDNALTGLLFLAGIFWGAYASGTPSVAWGAVLGAVVSTLTGYLLRLPDENGSQGLWGFNGTLVGCAFPTLLGNTLWMWVGLVICAAMTVWVRNGLNNMMGKWGVSSFTFPFVLCTWFFLLAARQFAGMPPTFEDKPEILYDINPGIALGFTDLLVYWLKGISQVFLINNWVTGILFLAGLAVSSRRAALWAAIASAASLLTALLWAAPGYSIANGLYGFSAVLTGIALGATFCNFSWRTAIWTLLGIIVTVFIQAAMNSFFEPLGLSTLTAPFCIASWLFLIPGYRMFAPK